MDAEVTYDGEVAVLTDDNFEQVLSEKKHFLVSFTQDRDICEPCNFLQSEFEVAAKSIAFKEGPKHKNKVINPDRYFGKVDITQNNKLFNRFAPPEGKTYPFILFFTNYGKSHSEYTDAYKDVALYNFIKNKTEKTRIDNAIDCFDVQKKVDKNRITLLYHGQDIELWAEPGATNTKKVFSPSYQLFQELSDGTDMGFSFVRYEDFHCDETPKIASVAVQPAFAIYNPKAKEPVINAPWDMYRMTPKFNEVVDWMKENSDAVLTEFNEEASEKLFFNKNDAIVLFVDNADTSKATRKIKHMFRTVQSRVLQVGGKETNILFYSSGTTEGPQFQLARFMGIKDEDLPQLVAIRSHASEERKPPTSFKFDGKTQDLTISSAIKFIQQFRTGEMSAHFKSEDVPQDNSGPVQVIVGKNYKEVTSHPDHEVVVNICAPQHDDCVNLEKDWQALALTLQDTPNLVFASFDAIANEVDGLEIRTVPMIMFYPKGQNKQPRSFTLTKQDAIKSLKIQLGKNSREYAKAAIRAITKDQDIANESEKKVETEAIKAKEPEDNWETLSDGTKINNVNAYIEDL